MGTKSGQIDEDLDSRFRFGKNWKSYLKTINEDRIERAKEDLRREFEVETLEGARFLDIGCGSGLFSLAAYELGAEEIVSFDYDPDSVECCRTLRERAGAEDWEVMQGDMLDEEFVADLGPFDYVYCWGVAHHTGDMWTAIDNTTIPVAEGGRLCLGIYHKVKEDEHVWNTKRAIQLKKFYNRLPVAGRVGLLGLWCVAVLAFRLIGHRENPVQYVREYKQKRGMSFWHDQRDWLGGYPFEAATQEEIEAHFRSHHSEMELANIHIRGTSPEMVNVFTFERDCSVDG